MSFDKIKTYKLGLGCIFCNESHIMQEWITFYLKFGVEHFYMINNNSTDESSFRSILEPYIQMNIITLFESTEKYKQVHLYDKHILPKAKEEYEWLMMVDLDEFVYPTHHYKTIPEVLDKYFSDCVSVRIPWLIFGSNGYIHQPESVIKSFIKRYSYDNTKKHGKTLVKTIARPEYVKSLTLHCYYYDTRVTKDYIATKDSKYDELRSSEQPNIYDKIDRRTIEITEKDIDNNFVLLLNHYINQSEDFYENVKTRRGDAHNGIWNSMRNRQFFDDINKDAIKYDVRLLEMMN